MTRFFLRPSHVSRYEGGILLTTFFGYLGAVYLTS